jgi:hypothetical protein
MLVAVIFAGPSGCRERDQQEAPSELSFEDRLLEIAQTYKSYRLVADKGRWAPVYCRAPDPYLSRGDPATHGQKLYWLYVKDVPADGERGYLPQSGPVPVGQVLVKEAWVPEQGEPPKAKEKAGLFIMFKLDPGTPDTDEGWVYGTVTADGKTVTSAGRVGSCMACHKKAPHDRLFGLPKE